jgi:Skp family chaperone for outer membrane proteins
MSPSPDDEIERIQRRIAAIQDELDQLMEASEDEETLEKIDRLQAESSDLYQRKERLLRGEDGQA